MLKGRVAGADGSGMTSTSTHRPGIMAAQGIRGSRPIIVDRASLSLTCAGETLTIASDGTWRDHDGREVDVRAALTLSAAWFYGRP